MKGSIFFDKRMKRYCVLWYDSASKKTLHIWKYKGMKMEERSLAVNLLASMQGDWENRESVKKYAKVEVATQKALLEKRVLKLVKKEREAK